jgi:hypothetical protein
MALSPAPAMTPPCTNPRELRARRAIGRRSGRTAEARANRAAPRDPVTLLFLKCGANPSVTASGMGFLSITGATGSFSSSADCRRCRWRLTQAASSSVGVRRAGTISARTAAPAQRQQRRNSPGDVDRGLGLGEAGQRSGRRPPPCLGRRARCRPGSFRAPPGRVAIAWQRPCRPVARRTPRSGRARCARSAAGSCNAARRRWSPASTHDVMPATFSRVSAPGPCGRGARSNAPAPA